MSNMLKVLFKEIHLLITNGGTVGNISRKYDVPLSYINNLIEKIKENDFELYTLIRKKLELNQWTWFINICSDILNLGQIILTLGDINNKGLSNEQKVKFAYLYKKYIHNSLNGIYKFDYKKYCTEYSEYFSCIDNFFKNILKFNYLYGDLYSFETCNEIRFNNNWFKEYNKHDFFAIKTVLVLLCIDMEKMKSYLPWKLKNILLNV